MGARLWAVGLMLALGCAAQANTSLRAEIAGPHTVPASASESDPAARRAQDAAPAELPTALEGAPPPPAPDRLAGEGVVGVIDRAGLVGIIDAGLGRLFQRVRVAAELKNGRFVGFRITQLEPGWAASLLAPGDVITALNGQPVERPEQALAAFERLRGADELVVDFLREGVPTTLRYRIE